MLLKACRNQINLQRQHYTAIAHVIDTSRQHELQASAVSRNTQFRVKSFVEISQTIHSLFYSRIFKLVSS